MIELSHLITTETIPGNNHRGHKKIIKCFRELLRNELITKFFVVFGGEVGITINLGVWVGGGQPWCGEGLRAEGRLGKRDSKAIARLRYLQLRPMTGLPPSHRAERLRHALYGSLPIFAQLYYSFIFL